MEKDILGSFIREGKEDFWRGTRSLRPGRDLCLGIDTVTGVARGFGLGGPGYP